MARFPCFTLTPTLSLKCAATVLLISVVLAHAQRAALANDGEAITDHDIEQRAKLDLLMSHKGIERDGVIKEIVDDRAKVDQARKLGVDLTSTKIDAAFAEMCARMHVTPERLMKSLEERGVQVETLKDHIKADMARASLAGQRYRKPRDPQDIYQDPYYKHQDPPLLRQ